MELRLDDANASPFDAVAYLWFFGFLMLMCLPWFRSRRVSAKRERDPLAPMNVVEPERRWSRSWWANILSSGERISIGERRL
jgi:hypothetical protein